MPKAVVFSQWRRSHDLIACRLDARGWGHVLFHGGVPGDKRGALVDRFHADPACRVFLATDAGAEPEPTEAVPMATAEAGARPAPTAANPWAPLLEAGLQFLGGLASGQAPGLETDPETGRAYLKLPVPEPAAVQRLADALRDLLTGGKS